MAMKKVEEKNCGLKVLGFGEESTGKSWFAQTFPNSGVVDAELSQAWDAGKDIVINGKTYNEVKFIDDTLDLDDLEEDLDDLIDGNLDIDTFVVDGESKFYQAMELSAGEVEERKAKKLEKAVDTRSKWGRVKIINMKLQSAKLSVSARGKHVVSLAQENVITKDVKKGKTTEQVIVGYKPEANKKLPHDYDIILRFVKIVDPDTEEITERYAVVKKDRTHVTKIGDKLYNPTYDIWKDVVEERKKKGVISGTNFKQDMKDATATILSEAEQVEKLSKEIIEMTKKFKDNGDTDNLKSIIKEAKTLGIEMKDLAIESVEKVKALHSFTKNLK